MNGLQRYETLVASLLLVDGKKAEIWRESNRVIVPAHEKLMRVADYLKRQAEEVMEGRTEDGWEEGDVRAGRVLLRSMGVEEFMRVADWDVWTVVGHVMSFDGYSQDEAEDIELRMAPAGWASVEGGGESIARAERALGVE